MNNSKSPSDTKKKKFKLTTLQLSALVILPLFVIALTIKVQERQEMENDKVVITKDSNKDNYMIQTSQPLIQNIESVEKSQSAK